MQPGPVNTVVVFSLYDETTENYQKTCSVLATYGFRADVEKDEYRDIDLPDHVLLGARVDHTDALRDLLLQKLREHGVQVKALLVGRLTNWAISGPSFW
jgi:hypothetical protein